jgi:hypothetical protein
MFSVRPPHCGIAAFGLRTKSRDLIELTSGYFQFMLLGEALTYCERGRSSKSAQQNAAIRTCYTSCVSKRLSGKLVK